MALREIVKFGEDVLRKKCRPVTAFDEKLALLLDDLAETLLSSDGVGLAAPQVGILKRVVVIDTGKSRIELVNPVITAFWGRQYEPEGCLSFTGKRGIVKRPMHVRVKAQDRFGRPVKYRGKDLLARAFCHEIDHLNGILYEDKVIEWVEDEEK